MLVVSITGDAEHGIPQSYTCTACIVHEIRRSGNTRNFAKRSCSAQRRIFRQIISNGTNSTSDYSARVAPEGLRSCFRASAAIHDITQSGSQISYGFHNPIRIRRIAPGFVREVGYSLQSRAELACLRADNGGRMTHIAEEAVAMRNSVSSGISY